MAINATAVWEVRTGGATTNGAGYDPAIVGGTDFTQQAAAQQSWDGAVNVLSSGGIGSTTITSNNALFTATMVGNAIHFTAGTNVTPGYYFITVFTNTTTVTVDRAPDNGGGAVAAGVGAVGGAHSDPSLLMASVVGGNTMFIQNGTFAISSAASNAAGGCLTLPAGTTANPSRLVGYSSSRALGNTGTKPLLQAGNAINTFSIVTAGTNSHVDNIAVDGASLTTGAGFVGGATSSRFYRCKASNCTNNGFNLSGSATNIAILCEATGCTTNPAINAALCFGCSAHDNTGVAGFRASNSGSYHVDCIASNNSGATSDGFVTGGNTTTWVNCTAYNNGRDGFRLGNGAFHGECINCIAENNAGWGFNASGVTGNASVFYSGGFNNTLGLVNNTNIQTVSAVGIITATAEIFNSPSTNDFSLNSNGGGGGLFKGGGVPGSAVGLTIPGLTTIAYLDAGVAQSQGSSGRSHSIAPGIKSGGYVG